MKVKELVEQLQKLDQDLTVYVTCEDPDVVVPGYFVRPFVINEVSATNIETGRSASGLPEIAAAAAGEGQKTVVIDITSDF